MKGKNEEALNENETRLRVHDDSLHQLKDGHPAAL
jgi:hypothetical protein